MEKHFVVKKVTKGEEFNEPDETSNQLEETKNESSIKTILSTTISIVVGVIFKIKDI